MAGTLQTELEMPDVLVRGAEAARRANKKFRSAPHIDVAVGVNLGSGHLDSPQEERLMSFGSNSSCAESVGFSTMSSAAR